MACNYDAEAVSQFLLPHCPAEGNFTKQLAYKQALNTYQDDHAQVWGAHE